nr:MAG TPA: Oligo alginate lyase [Caudoviricetes sp.]
MAVQNFYANQSAQTRPSDSSYNNHTSETLGVGVNGYVYLSFDIAGAANKFNVITDIDLALYLTSKTSGNNYVQVLSLGEPFDENTVTSATAPGTFSSKGYNLNDASSKAYFVAEDIGQTANAAKYIIANGVRVSAGIQGHGCDIQSSRASNKPYIIVTTSETTATGSLKNFAPSSGYIDLSQDNVFGFGFEQKADEPSITPLAVKSFTLQLREHGQTEITNINVPTWAGDAPNVTVPAGTISGESIDWRVTAKTNANQTLTSDWMTLSVEDVPPTAWAISPKDVVVDGSKDQIFIWGHASSTGTAQSKTDLQKSTDGSTWQTLATVTGAARQWTCPAGTLTSSIKYWRVRTYNADGIAGEWSDAAQIVVIAAPTAPSIQIKSTGPRPSISWQTSEQEAYQVELDGALSGGTHYGTEKTWTSPAYLADGSHTVRVRVQNQYGMWSDWGAAALPVTNTPGASITLSVQASSVADLSWQTSGSYDYYLVYRNGKPIAKLTQTQYTDELSSGSTTYQVRGCYADSSNYGLSSAVTVTITTGQYVTLYGIASGKKVTLKHCGLKNQPVQNAINRDIQYIFMYGSTYPHAERSEFVTKKVGGTAVFLPGEDKAGFDALIGELVCLKTQSGEMVIGYLNETSDTSRVNPDKSVVNFSIQQIDYAEVIDIDS